MFGNHVEQPLSCSISLLDGLLKFSFLLVLAHELCRDGVGEDSNPCWQKQFKARDDDEHAKWDEFQNISFRLLDSCTRTVWKFVVFLRLLAFRNRKGVFYIQVKVLEALANLLDLMPYPLGSINASLRVPLEELDRLSGDCLDIKVEDVDCILLEICPPVSHILSHLDQSWWLLFRFLPLNSFRIWLLHGWVRLITSRHVSSHEKRVNPGVGHDSGPRSPDRCKATSQSEHYSR